MDKKIFVIDSKEKIHIFTIIPPDSFVGNITEWERHAIETMKIAFEGTLEYVVIKPS